MSCEISFEKRTWKNSHEYHFKTELTKKPEKYLDCFWYWYRFKMIVDILTIIITLRSPFSWSVVELMSVLVSDRCLISRRVSWTIFWAQTQRFVANMCINPNLATVLYRCMHIWNTKTLWTFLVPRKSSFLSTFAIAECFTRRNENLGIQ